MTTADRFDADYGDPVFHTTFQAFAEALDGNGILDAGDLAVTAGSNANALDVAATTRGLWYNGALHTYGGGTNVITLSSNSAGSDRWDLIYFDTSTDTPKAREGTAATKPDLPELQSDEFPLAAVYVADGESDVTDSEIQNYRLHGSEAAETFVDDSPGVYGGDTVESALTSELQTAAQLTSYPLPIGDLSSPFALPSITDMDAAGNDLSDTSGPGTIYDATAGAIATGVLDNAVQDPGTTTGISPSFGTWTQVSASRPAWIEAEVLPQTDGSSDGVITIEVDESGGTTADYTWTARILSTHASGATREEYRKVYLPAGAQFRIVNSADPNAGNAIGTVREISA